MPLYDLKCENCGKEFDVFMSMSEAGETPWPNCECGGPSCRIYKAPIDHSENTFHPYWCENLCERTGDKVYIKSRAHERQLMDKIGVTKWEKGVTEDRKRERAYYAQQEREKYSKAIRARAERVAAGG
jgi:putative FmdB family regulatory protein